MMTFYCNNCGYYRPTTGLCQITGNTIDPNHAICDNFLYGEYYTCKACHTPIFHKQMIIDDQGNTYCDKCWAKLSSCVNCEQNVNCAFDASPDTPKIIQKREIVGNMQAVTNVRNPDIVEKTCKKGCLCFSEENGCLREINCCDKFTPIKN